MIFLILALLLLTALWSWRSTRGFFKQEDELLEAIETAPLPEDVKVGYRRSVAMKSRVPAQTAMDLWRLKQLLEKHYIKMESGT